MNKELSTLVFDIDGTICNQTTGDYEHATSYPEAIATINQLHDEGYRIVIHTARLGRCNDDVQKVYETGYSFTLDQLKRWGLKFHELIMGKPRADKIMDDRAVFFTPEWNEIYRQCRNTRSPPST